MAIEALYSQIQHLAFVERDGTATEVNVTEIVPGDVVHLRVGDVVPADLRVLVARELECDESVLTGESQASVKTADARARGDSPLDFPASAFMGTVVRGGDGRGLVVRTGPQTAFGAIALRLGERQGQTAFQHGLQPSRACWQPSPLCWRARSSRSTSRSAARFSSPRRPALNSPGFPSRRATIHLGRPRRTGSQASKRLVPRFSLSALHGPAAS